MDVPQGFIDPAVGLLRHTGHHVTVQVEDGHGPQIGALEARFLLVGDGADVVADVGPDFEGYGLADGFLEGTAHLFGELLKRTGLAIFAAREKVKEAIVDLHVLGSGAGRRAGLLSGGPWCGGGRLWRGRSGRGRDFVRSFGGRIVHDGTLGHGLLLALRQGQADGGVADDDIVTGIVVGGPQAGQFGLVGHAAELADLVKLGGETGAQAGVAAVDALHGKAQGPAIGQGPDQTLEGAEVALSLAGDAGDKEGGVPGAVHVADYGQGAAVGMGQEPPGQGRDEGTFGDVEALVDALGSAVDKVVEARHAGPIAGK